MLSKSLTVATAKSKSKITSIEVARRCFPSLHTASSHLFTPCQPCLKNLLSLVQSCSRLASERDSNDRISDRAVEFKSSAGETKSSRECAIFVPPGSYMLAFVISILAHLIFQLAKRRGGYIKILPGKSK